MPKKRIAASILLILVTVLLNFIIINYDKPVRSFSAQIDITMTLDNKEDIQIFYLCGDETIEDGFKPALSQVEQYKKADEEATLSYTVPADISCFRLDFGMGKATGKISEMSLTVEDATMDFPAEVMQDVVKCNDAKAIAQENELLLSSEGEDPYIIWNTDEWPITQAVAQVNAKPAQTDSIALCVCIDLVVLLILIFFHKAMIIPKELWHNRKLIFQLAKNDFKTRFAGSYLGIIWAFIQPIVTVLVYWFVFEKGLKAGGINTKAGIAVPFVLWLVAGLVPWFFFQEAWNGGTNALVEYSYLVKKVVFKISILPIVKVLSAMFVHLFFIAFTLLLYCGYGYYPDLYSLQIFYYTFGLFILVLGLSYATSALVGFFRDLTQIINIILQVGVWMTPIMWNIDTMELSPVLITVFKMNPLYYIVAGYRDALINKVWFWENPGLTIYFWLFTIVVFGVGVLVFKRLKVHFADVL